MNICLPFWEGKVKIMYFSILSNSGGRIFVKNDHALSWEMMEVWNSKNGQK